MTQAAEGTRRRSWTRGRSWSLRTRLTVMIVVLFVIAGAGLVGGQYLIANRLLEAASRSVTTSWMDFDPETQSFTVADTVPDGSASQHSQTSQSTVSAPGADSAGEDTAGADMAGEDTAGEGPAEMEGLVFGMAGEDGEMVTVTPEEMIGFAGDAQDNLVRSVLSKLGVWSAAVLVAFALIAALAASWIARRSLRRLETVTDAAREITQDHLDQRLNLAGPQDEIKELGDTFDGMLNRLDDAFAAQERFIANASHELRTPLTTARAALDIPLAQGRVPADLEPAVRRALAANEQSAQLLDALLALARTQSKPDNEAVGDHVDLAAVAENAIDELKPAAEALDVTIHADLSATPLQADEVMVEQVCRNLIENAIVHNRVGGEVWIDTRLEDGVAMLRVKNDGVPLTAEGVERLREPFQRGTQTRLARSMPVADSVPKHSGLGLGLSIVSEIVARSGGDLTLVAREEGGLDVVVRGVGVGPGAVAECELTHD